ncbi:hypothetical protein J1605_017988 [Eschrichtius robustus]|uniref:CID domain-containing protein n=1 Tax=Eschrichtius robustus TaxID=9764 RepID=A0AB34HZZ7_ESCRO|nr:hypothetical protein J1605_017988 [Eschrichtius robustus]
MSAFSEAALEKKLSELSNSQQSVQTLSLWLIHHRKHSRPIVTVWERELRKGESAAPLGLSPPLLATRPVPWHPRDHPPPWEPHSPRDPNSRLPRTPPPQRPGLPGVGGLRARRSGVYCASCKVDV